MEGKLKCPEICAFMHKFLGIFWNPVVQFVFISVSLSPRLALSVNAIIHA